MRFGKSFRDELLKASNIDIFLNANVSHIQLDETGVNVKDIRFSSYNKIEHTLSSKCFLICSGGVENSRLLLLSDDIHSSGIGNRHDNVGRYFMEHSEFYNTGNIMAFEDENLFDWDLIKENDGKSFLPVLSPTLKTQEKLGILNAYIELHQYSRNEISNRFRDYHKLFSSIYSLRGQDGQGRDNFSALRISIKSEMEPKRENRVFLSKNVDEMGLRKAQLMFTVSGQNIKTIESCFNTLSKELSKSSKGKIEVHFDSSDAGNLYRYGNHHMGGTRMGNDLRTSVVDKNCKVHGISNLYISGSSVFPTSGCATPTLTIVALALRLGDHIKEELKNV